MRDANEEVRGRATFGLGVLADLDSADIRDALLHRLSDSNEDVRNEAMAMLGKRRDRRVLPSLPAGLERPPVAVPG
jgi:HEAT repeat protein